MVGKKRDSRYMYLYFVPLALCWPCTIDFLEAMNNISYVVLFIFQMQFFSSAIKYTLYVIIYETL